MSKRDSGLTLIEMIIVLAMCAILAACMFPLLMKARGEARRVVCTENLSRLGIAVNTVLPTKNGYFTNCYYNVTVLRDGTWWVGLKNDWDQPDPLVQAQLAGAYMCPSAGGYVTLSGSKDDGTPVEFATTYAHNIEMPVIASNLTRVPQPSSRVILYDGDAASVVGEWEHTRNWPEKTINLRHNKMANFLFLDGHVETNGVFRAEPFHGCPMGRVDLPEQTPIMEGEEILGHSSWVMLANLNIHPESNNINNNGGFVQCTIRLPRVFDQGWINESKLYLVGAAGQSFKIPLPAVKPINQSVDQDGTLIMQCKFDRQLLYSQLVAGNFFGRAVPMRVVGEMQDGRPFEGIDANCVFDPPSSTPGNPKPPTKPPKK